MRVASLLFALCASIGGSSAKPHFGHLTSATIRLEGGEEQKIGYVGEWICLSFRDCTFKVDMEDAYRSYARALKVEDAEQVAQKLAEETPFTHYTVGFTTNRSTPVESVLVRKRLPSDADADYTKTGGEMAALLREAFENKDMHPYLTLFDVVQRPFLPNGMLSPVLREVLDMSNKDAFETKKSTQWASDVLYTFVYNIPNDKDSHYRPERVKKILTRWSSVLDKTPDTLSMRMAHTNTPVKSVVVKLTQTGVLFRHIDTIELYSVPIEKTLPETSADRILLLQFHKS